MVTTEYNKKQLIKKIVTTILDKNPELITNFNEKFLDAVKGISNQYKLVLKIIRKEYPDGHPLRSASIIDALIFSIAYCSYIIPKFFNNKIIIDDFINNKFIGKENKIFNFKKYNEGLSEFEIFLFLFFGLFCVNNNYHSFISLDYEPKGNSNCRFEYSFKFNSLKVNIEVKEIDCAPESRDKVNLSTMKNGQLFYKKYFPDKFINTKIPNEITK